MQKTEAFTELERGVYAALETYSNVHRGSGQNSVVSTYLFEHAREIVLEFLGLEKGRWVVIFCSPGGGEILKSKLKPGSFRSVSGYETSLPLGVTALAVINSALPAGAPFRTGGGTTTIVSPGWIIWANAPHRFEAGTPAIINIIAFAKALCLIRKYGDNIFRDQSSEKLTVDQILYRDELENYSGRKLLEELRLTMIGRNKNVPTIEGVRPYINFDNSASTPTFTPVWNTVCQTWQQPREIQQEIVREVRSICLKMMGVSMMTHELIFTSNTTESINLTAENLSLELKTGTEPVILSTILEHTSNDLPWRFIPKVTIERLKVDTEGFLDLNELDSVLSAYNLNGQHGNKRIILMSVTGASNVLGSINDLEGIARIVHKYGARLFVDAAQLVAHRKVEMDRWGIDYLAFSAHKVYAPFGAGVLICKKDLLNYKPSGLEQIKSGGEENAGGIAALGKAMVLIGRIGLDVIIEEEQALTARILNGFSKIEGLRVYGINDPFSPRIAQKAGVVVFTLQGLMSDKLAGELAVRGGIGIRYGCHCAHILVKHILSVSPSLEQFQKIIARLFPRLRFPGVARVSIGIGNTGEEVDYLIHVISKIASGHKVLKTKEAEKRIKGFARNAALRVYSGLEV